MANLVLQEGLTYKNINGAQTTRIFAGSGVLVAIVVNTNGGTAVVYDNTAESGTKIASIASDVPEGTLEYNAKFSTGLTIVTGSTIDITVVYWGISASTVVVGSVSTSLSPSISPSISPSTSPSVSVSPSPSVSVSPSVSISPSISPSFSPSISPSFSPSISPSKSPSFSPSISPSFSPSISPSKSPSTSPSVSVSPSISPSSDM